MQNENEAVSPSVAQAFLPVSAAGGSTWQITGRNACATALWSIAGVAALALAGMAINQIGVAAKMPYACWQLTGARAAASTAVLGGLVSLRRGNLALLGALYGLWLMAGHQSAMLVGSSILAGVAAWMIGMALADRGLIVRLLATTLAFNVLLTTSGLIKALSGDPASHITPGSWASGAGLRVLATVAIVGVFAIFTVKRSAVDLAADERR